MRFCILNATSKVMIGLSIVLGTLSVSSLVSAGPAQGPYPCVYMKACTTNGYTDTQYFTFCAVPINAGPATSGFGAPGTKIYYGLNFCADQYNVLGNPTGYGCGDTYAHAPCP